MHLIKIMKTKKIIIGLGILCLNAVAYAQGLEGIVVEKYYLTNDADGANALAEGSITTLNTGTTVYRVYVDMAAGYKYSQIFGSNANNLKVNTTTNFYNDPSYGVTINPATVSVTNIRKNTMMIDSWFTTGGTAVGKVGVLKSEDTDGALVNAQGILANNAGGCFGLPINGSGAQDGFVASTSSTYLVPNALGLGSSLACLEGTTPGNSILITNGAIAALGGIVGATSSNMVLIGQFTTDGVFTFELNLQLVNIATGLAENYVASNPTGSQLTHPSLTRGSNLAPTGLACWQTATFNNQTCTYDITGTQPVQPTLACYQTAAFTNCEWVLTGTQPVQPTLACYETAAFNSGTCAWVVSGTQPVQPTLACYETAAFTNCAWVVSGTQPVQPTTACYQTATFTNCAWVLSGTQPVQPTLACYETAAFNTGTCAWVVSGTQESNTTTQSVYNSFTWTNNGQTYTVSGTYTGNEVNCVAQVLNLTILAPEYKVLSSSTICSETLYQVPVATSSPYSVNDVKGYDVVINYDATKLVPTGNVTITNELINSTYVESSSSIASPGVLNLTINLNGSAPASAEFNGNGTIFNVGFTKLAGFNAIDSSIVSVPFMQESYITGVQAKSVKSAKMYSTAIQSYTGNLVFWSDSSPITYNSASPSSALITNIYGSTGSPVTPNQNGQFTSNLSSGLDLSIQRDIINENSVQAIVNAADAVLGKTLLIDGAFTPSVYQIIALDVNLDGVVSAGDISQMKQRTTLSIPEYMQSWNYNNQGVSNGSPSKDWIFVDNARIATPAYLISGTFPANDNIGFSKARVPQVPFILPMVVSNYTSNNSTCPTVGTETYKGIMLGDVNGSYASYTADGLLKSEDALITIDLSQAVINGNKVTVPVVITSDEPVNALDLAFEFNESKLSFDNVSELAQNIEAESFFNQNDRTFRYSAYTLENFKLNQSVALISFESTDGTINKKDFHSLMGLLNGKPVDVSFEKAGITSSILDRISIYPNPSNGNFTVVSSEDVNIEILEMSGKLLKEVSVKSNQEQAINLDNVSAGVYLIRVFNQNSSSTQRIVIAK